MNINNKNLENEELKENSEINNSNPLKNGELRTENGENEGEQKESHVNSIYLDKLEFDKKLNKSWMSFFIDRTRFTWLVILVIIIAGLLGMRSLPLESMPEIDIGIGYVYTIFPGASPESVEDLVTKKLEKEIGKVDGVDTIESTSMNSVSLIIVQFLSTADTTDSMRDLRDKVDGAKSQLPADAEDPVVREISIDDSPVRTFSLSGDYDGFQLYEYAKIIKEEIEKNPLVSEVTISGGEEKEFGVKIDPTKLEQYSLTLSNVNTAIQSLNITVPIGDIEVGDYVHSINVDSRFYEIEDLQNLIVKKIGDTGIVYLKDVAEVAEVPKKLTSLSRLSIDGGETLSAVTMSVTKKRGGSIVNLVSDGQEAIKNMQNLGNIPDDLYITDVIDNGAEIKKDLSHLIRDGIITILLVFVSLSLIIGTKEALVAGTAVPLVFLVTFAVMALAGQTLNFLSMFSLILSLGLLVDDAIVIISAINQYRKTGRFTTREAALLVIRDYKQVLLTTTLTVVFIFGSMLFMTGMVGKFVFSIPFVVCVTLITSLVIALTINPALAVMISGRDKKVNYESSENKKGFKAKLAHAFNHGVIDIHKLEKSYGKLMDYIISKKFRRISLIFVVLVLFVFSVSLPVTGVLKTDFFPAEDAETFTIDIEAEPGTRLDVTSEITKQIEEYLYKEDGISTFSTSIGSLSSGYAGTSSSESYASISVSLVEQKDGRLESSMDIVERLRGEFKSIKDAKITVIEDSGTSSFGADFEVRIAGDDFEVLDSISKDLVSIVETIPGAIDIKVSRQALPFEFNIALDETKMALYNITVPQVASYLRNIIDGSEVTTIYKGDDEIAVRTIFETNSVDTLDKIKDLKIKNNLGVDITLRDIINIEFNPSVFSISRVDQERVVTVSASANNTTNGTLIQQEFSQKIANYELPNGYKFITGGMNEQMAQSMSSLFTSMLFGMILIIATLILLYNSYIEAFLVMVTIPLSLIGVFTGLTLFGQLLSFPAMIGMVALFGIVVRNGIILFDKINHNLKEGIPFKESIIDAGMSRLEPVLLTSICTALGMIPLSLSNPMWTGLGLAIICGLTVSTIFTLVVLPNLYYMVFRRKYEGKKS